MRARLSAAASSALAVLLLASCSGLGDSEDSAATEPAATTPDHIRTAVYERSLSECASTPLRRIAAKYRVEPRPAAVAEAVGRSWTERFGGGDDAIAAGRDGCRQGFQQR